MSYLKSIYLQKNKEVFDVKALDLEEYSRSVGLLKVPRLKFLFNSAKDTSKESKNASRKKASEVKQAVDSDDEGSDSEDENEKEDKIEPLEKPKIDLDLDDDKDDELLTFKRRLEPVDEPIPERKAPRRLKIKQDGTTNQGQGQKVVFDENAQAKDLDFVDEAEGQVTADPEAWSRKIREIESADALDKKEYSGKLKKKRTERKIKDKMASLMDAGVDRERALKMIKERKYTLDDDEDAAAQSDGDEDDEDDANDKKRAVTEHTDAVNKRFKYAVGSIARDMTDEEAAALSILRGNNV